MEKNKLGSPYRTEHRMNFHDLMKSCLHETTDPVSFIEKRDKELRDDLGKRGYTIKKSYVSPLMESAECNGVHERRFILVAYSQEADNEIVCGWILYRRKPNTVLGEESLREDAPWNCKPFVGATPEI